jgi:hypothetical protein
MALRVKALQYKVSLGFIKLADFLALIQFNHNGVAVRTNIVQAFQDSAEKDAEAVAEEDCHAGVQRGFQSRSLWM